MSCATYQDRCRINGQLKLLCWETFNCNSKGNLSTISRDLVPTLLLSSWPSWLMIFHVMDISSKSLEGTTLDPSVMSKLALRPTVLTAGCPEDLAVLRIFERRGIMAEGPRALPTWGSRDHRRLQVPREEIYRPWLQPSGRWRKGKAKGCQG